MHYNQNNERRICVLVVCCGFASTWRGSVDTPCTCPRSPLLTAQRMRDALVAPFSQLWRHSRSSVMSALIGHLSMHCVQRTMRVEMSKKCLEK